MIKGYIIKHYNMKYINEYLEKVLKIKPLGKVTFDECSKGEEVGYEIVIDGHSTGIEVWWADYATWLEKKIEGNWQNSEPGNGQLG